MTILVLASLFVAAVNVAAVVATILAPDRPHVPRTGDPRSPDPGIRRHRRDDDTPSVPERRKRNRSMKTTLMLLLVTAAAGSALHAGHSTRASWDSRPAPTAAWRS